MRKKPPILSPKMEAYLATLPHETSVTATCKTLGMKPKVLSVWRHNPLFKAEEAALRERLAAERGELSRHRQYASRALQTEADQNERWDSLDRAKKVFLLVFQKERDRIKACRASGLSWVEVKAAMKEDEPFAAAVGEIEEELEIQLKDAQRRRAIDTGDPAAINALRRSTEAEEAASKRGRPTLDRKARVELLKREKAGAPN